ncbi:MAG: hypothetical protein U0704_04765 [Candidatus Eisenbacteria bacterium]
MRRRPSFIALALFALLVPASARAVVTVYFDPSQVATLVQSGVTFDVITCQGYEFTYTRDKLFTGGTGTIIGRAVRVPWPDGIEAQYVTAGPNPTKAQIRIRRVDGGLFDLTSFTAKLLANAGAGRAIEIVPKLAGNEPLNDPLYFDVSGSYGNSFSYDTTPTPWGSTAALVNYDEYLVGLTLDYALTALTLTDASAPLGVEPGPLAREEALWAAPNPARGPVQVGRAGVRFAPGTRVEVYGVRGEHVRTLAASGDGVAHWDLADEQGRAVGAGLYFARASDGSGRTIARRIVVAR